MFCSSWSSLLCWRSVYVRGNAQARNVHFTFSITNTPTKYTSDQISKTSTSTMYNINSIMIYSPSCHSFFCGTQLTCRLFLTVLLWTIHPCMFHFFKCFEVVMFKLDLLSVDVSRSSPIIKCSLAPPLQALLRATPISQHPINNCSTEPSPAQQLFFFNNLLHSVSQYRRKVCRYSVSSGL